MLGHRAVAHGADQLGPAADDPAALGVAADVEAVDVLDEEDRQPALVAFQHEPRGLVGAVAVDHAAELERPAPFGPEPQPLAGDDPQRHPAQIGRSRRRASGRTRRGTRRAGRRRAGRRAGRGRRTGPRSRCARRDRRLLRPARRHSSADPADVLAGIGGKQRDQSGEAGPGRRRRRARDNRPCR